MKTTQFSALFKARTMEFVRDRGTFFWNLLFPIIMVAGFAFAFSGSSETLFKVGVYGNSDNPATSGNALNAQYTDFLAMSGVKVIQYDATQKDEELQTSIDRVRKHQLDLVLDFPAGKFYVNSESAKAPVLRKLVGSGNLVEQQVTGKPIRYVDWVVPGIIGMNMMFSCLFGVGFVLVRYRKNGVLKRFKATPVNAFVFILAQGASRLVIVFITSVVVFAGTNAFLGFRMEGSYLTLAALLLVAIVCMISLGLAFATRFRSEELASGLLNLVTYPMMILSGVFFSLEGSPAALRVAAKALPLTHFIDGARAVMIDGAGFAGIAPQLTVLVCMSAFFLAISALLFRWE